MKSGVKTSPPQCSTWLYWLLIALYTLHPQTHNQLFKMGTIYTGSVVYCHLLLTPVLGLWVSTMALVSALALAPHLHTFGPPLPSPHKLPKPESVKGLGLLSTDPAHTRCILRCRQVPLASSPLAAWKKSALQRMLRLEKGEKSAAHLVQLNT